MECEIEAAGTKLSCTFENELPAYESIEIDVLAKLTGEPPSAGAPGKITVSGGGAEDKSASQDIKVSPENVAFGIERFSAVAEAEGGAEETLAGKHPFQLTTTIQFNAGQYQPGRNRLKSSRNSRLSRETFVSPYRRGSLATPDPFRNARSSSSTTPAVS